MTEAKQDTTPTEEVYDIADEYADENTEMLLELASSIADIEESMKKFKGLCSFLQNKIVNILEIKLYLVKSIKLHIIVFYTYLLLTH